MDRENPKREVSFCEGETVRLGRLWLDQCNNLGDVTFDFDEKYLTTVLIGQNTTGKSNLIGALVSIFRNVDLGEDSTFCHQIRYECRSRLVEIRADPQGPKIQISVDEKSISYTSFRRQRRKYLPSNVFGFYSITSTRLEGCFTKHQERFYRELLKGKNTPLRPLFFARTMHSQYVLLAFFSFEDESVLQFLREYLGIEQFVDATFILKQPKWYKKKDEVDFFWVRCP